MIPKEPTTEMIEAGRGAVSGFPRSETIASIWRAMWEVAQAIEARRAETGTGSVHESAVATPCAQTPGKDA